jgi:hypothetical protein
VRENTDMLWATLGEGGLVSVMSAISWAINQPLIFASLGPTAYELVEQPHQKSARAYNIVVGHLIGLGAAFLALFLLNAWAEPNVIATGVVSTKRMWAMALAAALTVLFTLAANAAQPASLATTLLVALGAMQTRRDAIAIALGVLIISAIGEPLRRLRLKQPNRRQTLAKMQSNF